VFLDFYKKGCPPCGMLAPVLDELAKKYKDIRFIKFRADDDHGRKISSKFLNDFRLEELSGFPYMVMKNGKKLKTITGFRPKENLSKEIDSFY